MTIIYYPFDAGAGSSIDETKWGKMMRAWMNSGVIETGRSHIDLNKFEVFGDSSGMQVKVKSGAAWIEGFFVESSAEEIVTINTADPTNPRIDRIILKVDWSANSISLTKLTGTPDASPSIPTLTQDASTWEISLARVAVGAGVTTITSGNVTDERSYIYGSFMRLLTINAADKHQTLTDGATINWNMDNGGSAQVTLGGNRTMAAPTRLRQGATYVLQVIQDGTGSRTITWNSIFKWPGGATPLLSTAASSKDLFSFYCPDGVNLWGNVLKAFS
jgi:hypothetical protein